MSNSTNDLITNLNNAAFWINRISPIITIVLGTFGNFFNIIIFTRRPLRTNPCSMYFLAGSIVNCAVMYVALLTRYLATSWNIDPSATNIVWCKVRYFLIYPFLSLALWFIVLASIDRYLSSSHDVRHRQLSTMSIARKLIIIITVFMFLINMHVLFFARIDTTGGTPSCTIFPNDYLVFFNIFVPIISCILPVILMSIFGILTIFNVRMSRNRVVPQDNNIQNERLRSNDRQLIIMLLCQVTIITIIVAPWSLINMYSAIGITILEYNLSPNGLAIYNFAFNLFRMLYYMTPVIGFYIYTLSAPKFRIEIKKCILYGLNVTLTAIALTRYLPLRIQRTLLNENQMGNNNNIPTLTRRGNNVHTNQHLRQINTTFTV